MLLKSLNKRLKLHASFFLILSQVIFIVGSYLVVVFNARFFTIEDYGNYAFIMSIISWIELFLTIGFHNYIISFDVLNNKKKLIGLVSFQFCLSLFSMLIIIYQSVSISTFFRNPGLSHFFIFASFDFLPFAAYSSSVAILNELKEFKKQSVVMISYAVAKPILMIATALIFKDISKVFLGMAAASFLAFSIGILLITSHLEFRKNDGVASKTTDKESDKSGLFLSIIITLLVGFLFNFDFWLIKRSTSDTIFLGNYGVVVNLSKAFYAIISIIFYKYYVHVKDYINIFEGLKSKEIKHDLILIFILYLLYIAFIFVFLKEFIHILFGVKYDGAIDIAMILLPVQGAYFLAILLNQTLFYFAKRLQLVGILSINSMAFVFLGLKNVGEYLVNGLIVCYAVLISISIIMFLLTQINTIKTLNDE